MKSTLNRISITGILLLVVFISTFAGQVKNSHAQADTDWADPINLSKSGATSTPSMVVDNEGVIHAIWVDAVDGYVYAESKNGSNFQNA